MAQIRVNLRTQVNNASIRRETRNGREVIIVPSATLPDDVVMNRIKYPADVIAEGYQTLERTPAPLGHPVVNGVFINAKDPEAINGFWVGAWNENVRRESGRVFLDKVIDVERAESTDAGKRLVEAINKGDPIHTSTGLFLEVDEVEEEDYDMVATNMLADHDAFLLDEQGAATPEQGVGVFVNSSGEKMEVINSEIDSDMMDVEGAISYAFEVLERKDKRKQRNGLISKVVSAMQSLLNSDMEDDKATGLSVNQSDEVHDMTPEELQAMLDKQAEALQANFKQELELTVKPLQEQVEAFNAERTAQAEAEKAQLVEQVTNAQFLDEETAKTLEVNALRKLAEKCKPGDAAPLFGAFNGEQQDDYWANYNPYAAAEEDK